jgi:hypothetical protein
MSPFINSSVVTKRSFKDFKIAFYKNEWRRNISYRTSFFDLTYNRLYYNYIHASIIIINGVGYKFTFLSYLKFLIFIYLNRTTEENINKNINTKKDIRREKLKKLNI